MNQLRSYLYEIAAQSKSLALKVGAVVSLLPNISDVFFFGGGDWVIDFETCF